MLSGFAWFADLTARYVEGWVEDPPSPVSSETDGVGLTRCEIISRSVKGRKTLVFVVSRPFLPRSRTPVLDVMQAPVYGTATPRRPLFDSIRVTPGVDHSIYHISWLGE